MIPAHVAALRPDFSHHDPDPALAHPADPRRAREVLARPDLRDASAVAFAAIAVLAVAAAGTALAIRASCAIQFFAFDPLRIFYVNVDMPAGAPIEATLERLQGLEPVVKKHLNPANVRAITAAAGVKFTDTEPVFGDAYGQLVVTLQPRGDDTREAPEIVEALRKDVLAVPGPGKVTSRCSLADPPPSKAIRVRVRNDD